MSSTKEQLESEIRAFGSQGNLSPADERRLAELTRELSSVIGHPVTVHRGDRSTSISVDVTPRGSRPNTPAKTTHRHSCPGCRGAGVIDASDKAALARLTPAARAAVQAQARNAAASLRPVPKTSQVERLARAVDSGATAIEQLGVAEVRSLAQREIEVAKIPVEAQERLDSAVRLRTAELDGDDLGRHLVITGRKDYVGAWRKSVTHTVPGWTAEESDAVRAYQDLQAKRRRRETRAMPEAGTGGLAVPWFLDPTLRITAGVQTAAMLDVCSVPLTTTNNFHAFSAPGTAFTFTGEDDVIADNSATYAGPTIPVLAAKSFLPFSIEYGMDQPNWAENATTLFSNAFAESVSAMTSTGNGTTQPAGVFPALMGLTSNPSHCVVTTAGTLGAADITAAWAAVPERYRSRSTWMYHRSVGQRVAAIAASGGLAPGDYFTLPTGQHLLMGRPVIEVDDAPALSSSTAGTVSYLVVGDFHAGYACPMRVGGFTVELIPNLPNLPTSNAPTGVRAYLAIARYGGGLVDENALRVVANA